MKRNAPTSVSVLYAFKHLKINVKHIDEAVSRGHIGAGYVDVNYESTLCRIYFSFHRVTKYVD